MSYLSEEQRAKFRAIRAAMDSSVADTAGIPAKINAAMAMIRPWKPGTMESPVAYTANVDVRMHEGVPYTCAQSHTHRGEPGWEPGPDSALWKEAHGTTPETARPFVARSDNSYMTGEYCTEGGKTHRCKLDYTVYAPSVYPNAWEDA